MTFEEKDGHVSLGMTAGEYGRLLMIMAAGLGTIRRADIGMFWECAEFVNALNVGNPNYEPYAIRRLLPGDL
jgi:hypothetical protein